MIYPNTQDTMFGGGVAGDDNKKKLVDMLKSRLQAAPLFGGAGHSTTDLPAAAAPAIAYNPFLAMIAGRPGETFNDLPTNILGSVAAGVQNGPGPIQGAGSPLDPNSPGYAPTPPGQGIGTAISYQPQVYGDPSGNSGHYFGTFQPASNGAAPPTQTSAPAPDANQLSAFSNFAGPAQTTNDFVNRLIQAGLNR